MLFIYVNFYNIGTQNLMLQYIIYELLMVLSITGSLLLIL